MNDRLDKKLEKIAIIENLIATGKNAAEACLATGVKPHFYYDWKSKQKRLGALEQQQQPTTEKSPAKLAAGSLEKYLKVIESVKKGKSTSAACDEHGVNKSSFWSWRAKQGQKYMQPETQTHQVMVVQDPPRTVPVEVTSTEIAQTLAKLGWVSGSMNGILDKILSDKSFLSYFVTRGVEVENFENIKKSLHNISKTFSY